MTIGHITPIPWVIKDRGLYEAPLRVVRSVNELAVRATLLTSSTCDPSTVLVATAKRISEELNGEPTPTMTPDDSLMFLSWWVHVTMENAGVHDGAEVLFRLHNEFRSTILDMVDPEIESNEGRDASCDDCIHLPGRHWSSPMDWIRDRFPADDDAAAREVALAGYHR